MHNILFYNKFIILLYIFRALCAHHQEVKLYYTATGIITHCRWPCDAQVDRRPVHRTATYRVWWYQMLYNTILTSWWRAEQCSKHVEEFSCFANRASQYIILVINQHDAQNLFYDKFISCLYMFRVPCAHRQEIKIVLYSLWYHHTYRCDDDDEHMVLETCRGMK